jgi:cytochrome c oxidase subunit 1
MSEKNKSQNEDHVGFPAPGTFVLALIFLVIFSIFYFLNWKWLSMVWEVK